MGDDVPAMNRRVEIMPQPDGTLSKLQRTDNGNVRVDPWPFSVDDLTLELETQTQTRTRLAFGAIWAAVIEAGYGCLGVCGRDLSKQFDDEIKIVGSIIGNEGVSLLLENRKANQRQVH